MDRDWETAERLGLDNTPHTSAVIDNLRRWCERIGEPVRAHFGKPVLISSGYRGEELNCAIGGADRSQHMIGEAADFEVVGYSNLEVAQYIAGGLLFDQLILELWDGSDPHSGWVHCSTTARRNRGDTLQLVKGRGYVKGLPQ